ncbi:MAG TPA: hypothetical protein VIK31_07480 [Propionibacteriaceae bacterium]
MARPGRRPFEEELRLRERIEGLYLSGLRPAQIRDALASAQNQVPIELSLRQVQSYVTQLRRGWAKSLDPAQREAEWAELLAATKDVIRVAAGSSARYRDDALGVGYLNSELKGIALLAKLMGLDAPAPGGRGGPLEADVSPFAALPPSEQAASLHHLADLVAATA